MLANCHTEVNVNQPHVDLTRREVWILVGGIKCLWPIKENGRLGKVRKSRTGWGRDESSLSVPRTDFTRAVRICASAAADRTRRAALRVGKAQGELIPQ